MEGLTVTAGYTIYGYSVQSMLPLNVRGALAPPSAATAVPRACASVGCPHFQFCVVYEPSYVIFVVYNSVA